ncbi:MAG: bifunctional 3,4-dihydroxy-2-butanone-4-phosphate synthase/GTP cyclohydrolase II [Candidatus Omnitrophica bacterium]|nr:bifunctional 3,4-dihydroxy-2-butanone-4-phosphate synthase/GTP cyclohydrolase II [Candidatus Omnitrophota bacterium]
MFNIIPEIIEDLKNGKMVIVVDDEDRENEGDLVMAASFARPPDINFMAMYGRGLICVPMEEERLHQLGLEPMGKGGFPFDTQDPYKTGWMISVDAAQGITTGISAYDRAHTIEILINPHSKPEDLMRPGHIFPLRSRKGGVLVRAGHTEAAIDLMKLSGLYPAGVICEIMNDDGSMSRMPQLFTFSQKHALKICSITSLIEYRRRQEKLIETVAQAYLPTAYGDFRVILYRDSTNGKVHSALCMGQWQENEAVLVRVHSECLTGDVFGSLRCDCGRQLQKAMEYIGQEKKGVILYMNQEGRGIGLVDKIRAYTLQDKGMDTVEANEALGHKPDLRDYGIGAQILVDLGITQLKLLTNNPRKIVGLEGYGLKVIERVPLGVEPNPRNYRYLKTKKEKLGHHIEIE